MSTQIRLSIKFGKDDNIMKNYVWKTAAFSLIAALSLTGCSSVSSGTSGSGSSEGSGTASGQDGEKTEPVTLTYTCLGSGLWLDEEVFFDFNRGRKDYNAKLKSYDSYNDEDDYEDKGAIEQLKRDVITGDGPDILITSDRSLIELLADKGVFADLNEFMEKDPEVNRDTLLPNVLKALESSDGSLYALTPEFCVETMVLKSKFGQKENWTMDDMIDLFDSAPASADHLYDYHERRFIFEHMLAGMDSLVDYEDAECRFDSDDFVRMLEFVKKFPEKRETPDKLNEPEGFQNYYADRATWLANDRTYIMPVELGYDGDLRWTRDVEAKEDITLVGYPSENGKGGKIAPKGYFAILSTCSDKEGAWEFVRTYLSKDFQGRQEHEELPMYQLKNIRCYSPRKDIFKEQMDDTMVVYNFDQEKEMYVPGDRDDDRGYRAFTQAERDDLERYILSCDTLAGAYDSDVKSICLEEAAVFFAGDCSAQQAADYIQNRCSILVSEQS